MKFTAADEKFMRRALAVASRGVGSTSPNPAVGAVIVRGGKIIGEGFHQRAGDAHAEVNALRSVGRGSRRAATNTGSAGASPYHVQARGATLYVTLEPCCTHGRTPPCTDAIIAAGIKRVVVAATDPNPQHRGRGLALLRKAGIEVEAGLLADEATKLNAAFNKWITTGLPLVTAKAAMSLDGKIATRTGDSKWITGDAARAEAHRLRAQVDAIIVGANTVRRDDPQLTLRHGVRGRQPWRVVVDGRGRCPKTARLFTDDLRARTIVVTSAQSSPVWRRYLALLGIVVLVLPEESASGTSRDTLGKSGAILHDVAVAAGERTAFQNAGAVGDRSTAVLTRAAAGRVKLRTLLAELGRMEITSVLVEGGGELLAALFDARLVDRVAFFYAPIVIGGDDATLAVGGVGVKNVAEAVRLIEPQVKLLPDGNFLVMGEVQ